MEAKGCLIDPFSSVSCNLCFNMKKKLMIKKCEKGGLEWIKLKIFKIISFVLL